MRRFLRMAADGTDNLRWSKVALAKEVLAELPSQMMDYFERSRLAPSHTVPGQPRLLRDLADPLWWRQFTQPFNTPGTTEHSVSVDQKDPSIDQGRGPEESDADHSSYRSSTSSSFQSPAAQAKLPPDADPNSRLSSNVHLATVRCASASLNSDQSGTSRATSRMASVKGDDINLNQIDRPNPFPHMRRQMSLGPAFHSSSGGRKLPGVYDQVPRKPSTSDQ
ncbi:unnamed protein product [Echinostoma caproni]|uniref:Copine domain-containing protein n=1 Tax=Echinostoma caproni TaxID=27848 RepID=A0A183AF55_9TREM|nr:unnamed protein product [Echinostoma caproni]